MEGSASPAPITGLLQIWRAGDQSAQGALFDAIYPELRRLASSRIRGLARNSTIHPTELIHEAWIRIAKNTGMSFENRNAFYAATAMIMRRVLVDRARNRGAQKRRDSGDWPVESFTSPEFDLPSINEALEALELVCERQARQVDLRFFGGFSAEEASNILGVSTATLKRDWLAARMFIRHFLEHGRT